MGGGNVNLLYRVDQQKAEGMSKYVQRRSSKKPTVHIDGELGS